MQKLAAAAVLLALAAARPASAETPRIYEFPIPTAASGPDGIVFGPDGNLWFTEETGDAIGRMTTGGVFTEYPLPTLGAAPGGISTGPDGALWFTEIVANKIGRITTDGKVSEYPIPSATPRPAT